MTRRHHAAESAIDCARIDRLRYRLQSGRATLSVQRARLYTESWRATEGKGLSPVMRVATAMHHVYGHIDHYVDPDDRLAGHWTERFFGLPIDIERGVFNSVLQTELRTRDMVLARAKAFASAAFYVSRKRGLASFIGEQRQARSSGAPPLDMGLQTLATRKINPFDISADDKRELLGSLLPYWKGKTVVERLQTALESAGLISKDTLDFSMSIPGNTSQACVLLLHRDTDYFPDLMSILIYPSTYVVQTSKQVAGGIVIERPDLRLGESWSRGEVVLAWDSVLGGASDPGDGHNVVFHEFAHQLDQETGDADGAPVLPRRSMYLAWARVLGAEFDELVREAKELHKTDLDRYGATNAAEFFAVVTEAFFEKPGQLRRKHPALYEQMRLFYRQDPAARSGPATPAEVGVVADLPA